MKIFDMAKYLQAEVKGNFPNMEIKDIKMDSKEIEKGDVFLAYGKGVEYVEEAVSLGAIAVITEEPLGKKDIPIIKVKSSLEALAALASLKRKEFKGKIIAITGSNGKTSTKELLKFLLSFDRKVLANFESENNHIGVPKTLLKLNDSYDYVILEMGMNHAGEIKYLSELVHPDIGIITNIGTAHIGLLGSRKAIFQAKMELVEATPDITLFVNKMDRYLKKLQANQVGIEYSSVSSLPAINVSLACKVCEYLGYKREELERRLSAFPGVKSRMQKFQLEKFLLIDDAYNASYESICFGLESLARYEGKKLMIFGDILELGNFSERVHEKVYEEVQKYPDISLITIGDATAFLKHKPHFYSIEELKEYLKDKTLKGYEVIYLKASHKMGLSRLVPYLENL